MRFATVLAVAIWALVIAGCGGDDDASSSETDQAVATAMDAYDAAKDKGLDFASGPCIAEQLPGLDDWVADIAHDPREDVDDQAENQCQRYRDGEASHFVELTPEGELIRAE
jgi:hypothetical protein